MLRDRRGAQQGPEPAYINKVALLYGEPSPFYVASDCMGSSLGPGESCIVRVSWRGPVRDQNFYTATLVVHQNLAGPKYITVYRYYVP